MELKLIEQEVLNCQKCGLHMNRKNPVIGEGSQNAQIIFIGEAPGFNEDQQGKPFVGAAGKILNILLQSINLSREEIYVTNILKCHPPANRNPTNEEIKLCTPYLDQETEIIKPKIICCLGNFATKFIMKKYNLNNQIEGITKIHGKIFEISTYRKLLKIIPMFHPAVATYDMSKLDILKEDFKILKNELNNFNSNLNK